MTPVVTIFGITSSFWIRADSLDMSHNGRGVRLLRTAPQSHGATVHTACCNTADLPHFVVQGTF